MGYDVVIRYDGGDWIWGIIMSEALHCAIFDTHNLWKSYPHLRQLEDCYGGAGFGCEGIQNLVSEMEQYQMRIPDKLIDEYVDLLVKLKQPQLAEVKFLGD